MKSGFVAILGRPNVGKSTLLNALLSKKVSIVSPKAQTTRDEISGILNQKDLQIVFVDTPGIFTGNASLDKYMNKSAFDANKDVNATLYLVDASVDSLEKDLKILGSLKSKNIFIVLNKIDTIKPERGMELKKELQENFTYPIIEASLIENFGLKEIKDAIIPLIPEGMPFYPETMITDKDKEYQIREIIRQELLHFLKQEVPHQSAVKVDNFTENNGEYVIKATILVEKANHKGIVIGKSGQMIKKISMTARKELQRIWHEHINSLEIVVDVAPNWRNDLNLLKQLGYTND